MSEDLINRIRRPSRLDVRSVWPGEASAFTPWLASNLNYLDALDLGPLNLVDTEVTLPSTGRALDILAETGEGERIAIENQFARADHDHLTRALAYAVGLEATGLVLVAETHADEFVATAGYLNRAAESLGREAGAIGVFLVELRVEELDGWFIPRFDVVARPNEWLARIGPSRDGRLRSIEDFLQKSDESRRDALKEMLDYWQSLPGGKVTHNAKEAVALRMTRPWGGPPVAAITAYLGGGFWINRGYLVECVPTREPETAERVERIIRESFPRAAMNDYYVRDDEPRLEELRAFGDRLSDWFAELGRAQP